MNGHIKVLSIHTSFNASALSKLKNDISHVSRAANKSRVDRSAISEKSLIGNLAREASKFRSLCEAERLRVLKQIDLSSLEKAWEE